MHVYYLSAKTGRRLALRCGPPDSRCKALTAELTYIYGNIYGAVMLTAWRHDVSPRNILSSAVYYYYEALRE